MIKRLKLKFIVLAVISIFVLLSAIVAGMNIINYNSVVLEADEILAFLSENNGAFPDRGGKPAHGIYMPKRFSPETPYETRYFYVLMSDSGRVIETHTEQIISIDEQTAEDYAESIMESGKDTGFIGDYRYCIAEAKKGNRIIFLDCGRKLEAFDRFMFISVFMSFVGFAAVSVIIIIFSGKIIKPVAQSYEKQKRFITDAGHELKTPLTIINANVDLLESDPNDADCINDIRQQTQRLASLTNNLVYLAQLDENEEHIEKVETPLSDIVSETVAAFETIVQMQNKKIVCSVQPLLSIKGDNIALQQLVSVLVDNAIKYSPENSAIRVTLEKRNKSIEFAVSNTSVYPIEGDALEHIFDRFYRTDTSRNSETGGNGIGLSIAKKIMEEHKGKIYARTTDGLDFSIICLFRSVQG
ncbi:MAG: GHKL domain-containing protein [Oscillospiraceae bacterium]|nr:GHKL domain-containing protein [Oscillospiraceae bacterium]